MTSEKTADIRHQMTAETMAVFVRSDVTVRNYVKYINRYLDFVDCSERASIAGEAPTEVSALKRYRQAVTVWPSSHSPYGHRLFDRLVKTFPIRMNCIKLHFTNERICGIVSVRYSNGRMI
jgi:hypothetical protein